MSVTTACALAFMALLFASSAAFADPQAIKSECIASSFGTPQSLMLLVQGSSIKAEWQAPAEAAGCISYYQGSCLLRYSCTCILSHSSDHSDASVETDRFSGRALVFISALAYLMVCSVFYATLHAKLRICSLSERHRPAPHPRQSCHPVCLTSCCAHAVRSQWSYEMRMGR